MLSVQAFTCVRLRTWLSSELCCVGTTSRDCMPWSGKIVKAYAVQRAFSTHILGVAHRTVCKSACMLMLHKHCTHSQAQFRAHRLDVMVNAFRMETRALLWSHASSGQRSVRPKYHLMSCAPSWAALSLFCSRTWCMMNMMRR